MKKSPYTFEREAPDNEYVLIPLAKLNKLIDWADRALDSDSNDHEHNTLYNLREELANFSLKADAASIKSDYRLPPQISRAANDSTAWQRLK